MQHPLPADPLWVTSALTAMLRDVDGFAHPVKLHHWVVRPALR